MIKMSTDIKKPNPLDYPIVIIFGISAIILVCVFIASSYFQSHTDLLVKLKDSRQVGNNVKISPPTNITSSTDAIIPQPVSSQDTSGNLIIDVPEGVALPVQKVRSRSR